MGDQQYCDRGKREAQTNQVEDGDCLNLRQSGFHQHMEGMTFVRNVNGSVFAESPKDDPDDDVGDRERPSAKTGTINDTSVADFKRTIDGDGRQDKAEEGRPCIPHEDACWVKVMAKEPHCTSHQYNCERSHPVLMFEYGDKQ